MYAVIRRYTRAPQLFDELVRHQADVKQLLEGVPGFVSYYLVRSGDDGASITVCQDQAGTAESSRVAREWVLQNVPAAAATPPEVIEGEVLFSF
jgi:heme-degrading monooxygenase HmoA